MEKKYYCTGAENAPQNMQSCCKQHNNDYGVNGKVTRAEADKRLRECLISQERPVLRGVFGWQ